MIKKLLITGGTGYLGQHLILCATGWQTHATYFRTPPLPSLQIAWHHCDLRDAEEVRTLITALHPDVIIHTACSDRSLEDIEAIGPAARHLAQAADAFSCRLIHLSTDLIFDGEEAPYHEQSLPEPISDYGRAKAEAEHIVAALSPQAVLIRTSLMYGMDPVDRQTRWLLDGLDKGQTVRLFTDEIRCPIWVYTLAESLLEVAQTDVTGILHLAGPEAMTRWDIGLEILALHQRTPAKWVVPSTRAEAGLIRPRDLTMKIEKARQILRTPLLSLREVRERLHSCDSASVRPAEESTS